MLPALVVPAFLLSAACAPATQIAAKPPDGYQALRVTETQFVVSRLGGPDIRAGTIFVGDGACAAGTLVYFPVPPPARPVSCINWDGGPVSLVADLSPFDPLAVAPGSIQEIRVR